MKIPNLSDPQIQNLAIVRIDLSKQFNVKLKCGKLAKRKKGTKWLKRSGGKES